jgi:hypothetical protein
MSSKNLDELLQIMSVDPKLCRHLKLLADAFYEKLEREKYCEYGGWGLDDKRPFGSSNVHSDLAKIMEITLPDYETQKAAYNERCRYLDDVYNDLGLYLKYRWKVCKDVK